MRQEMSNLPDDPVLQDALKTTGAIAYEKRTFRVIPGSAVVHNLHFEHLWAGTGAGRCNPDGIARLYLSTDRETAQAEFDHHQRRSGLNPEQADFYSFAVEVKLARVLDLTDNATRTHLDISRDQILEAWEPDPLLPQPPPTRLQAIGYWVSKGFGNFSAILYPSARRKTGYNLVVFKERLGPGDSVNATSRTPTKGWP
jgi:RES domain-containing protein